jgi:thiamine biosynthesis lipoprotein
LAAAGGGFGVKPAAIASTGAAASAGAGRRRLLRCAWGLAALVPGLSPAAPRAHAAAQRELESLHWQDSALLALGTTVSLRVAHVDASRAQAALAAAVDAVQRVDAALSLVRPDSALVQLNREGRLRSAAAELRAALQIARQVSHVSGGAFDATIQPLWRTWYEAHLQGRVPAAAEITAAQRRLGWREVFVDAGGEVRLGRRGMALTLNGIAQGLAADLAGAALRRHGVRHALVDSGEWLPIGQAPGGSAWRLGVADPRSATAPGRAAALLATLEADGRALACSADDRLGFVADHSEHHILDPRSGHSPRQLALVVVAARSAAWADALTKPLFMGGMAQALALAKWLGVDALVVDKAGRVAATAGLWPGLRRG